MTYFASVLWGVGGACLHPRSDPVGLDIEDLWVPENNVRGKDRSVEERKKRVGEGKGKGGRIGEFEGGGEWEGGMGGEEQLIMQ